ncbi:MAG: DUF3298 domain-containing protein [Niabella sp.]
MNNRIFLASLLLICIVACKNNDKKAADNDNTPEIPATQSFSDDYFFKTLEGSIAGKPIIMHFLKTHQGVDANYYYTDQGQTIFLDKDWSKTPGDSIYLFEVSNRTSEQSPTLAMAIHKDGVKGIWSSGDGKTTYPFELKESTSQPTLHFNAASYMDSAQYLKFKTDTPTLKSSVTVVTATDDNTGATWLNSRLKQIITNGNKKFDGLSLPQTAAALVKDMVEGYNAEVDSSIVGIDKKAPHYFLNREYQTLSNIIYNQNGYVTLSVFNYAYTGGAHGNHGTSMYCFDTGTQKHLSLQDIVIIDSLKAAELLEKYYREQYNIPLPTPLDQSLFVKRLAPNNNFYFGPAGLGFVYVPYEIAPYASGEINIWIPFSELKPYLNPEFAKRMKL